MSKKIIEFEGFADQNPGWEFDMPVYMVKPMVMYAETSNPREYTFIIKTTSESFFGPWTNMEQYMNDLQDLYRTYYE